MKSRHNKTTPTTAITSLPPSPDEERRGRMIRYSIAMGVRLVCVIVAFVVPGWWAVVPAIGAIVLPYVAVVLANVGVEGKGGQVERPGGLEVYRPEGEVPGYHADGEAPRYRATDDAPRYRADDASGFPTDTGRFPTDTGRGFGTDEHRS